MCRSKLNFILSKYGFLKLHLQLWANEIISLLELQLQFRYPEITMQTSLVLKNKFLDQATSPVSGRKYEAERGIQFNL